MTIVRNLEVSVLVLSLASIYPMLGNAATSSGIAQFSVGDVSLRRPDGQSTPLAKGNDVQSGQSIVTGASGRAQVRFSDGGLVSLQPNSEFKITNYVDRADPQQDRFLVDFLRGSMRAVTGLIGKRNKENYRVTTTTATIGIRGSGFSAAYNPDGSLSVTAEKDAIEVCSGGVCTGLVAGESAVVRSNTQPPVRTVNRASIPTPGLAQDVASAGNQTNSDGNSKLIAKPRLDSDSFIDRTYADIKVIAVATAINGGYQYNAEITSEASTTSTFRDNKLLSFIDQSDGTKTYAEAGTAQPAASFQSTGNVSYADFVGWGMWTKGTATYGSVPEQLDNFHYVAGRPTSPSDMEAFLGSCSNCIYNYTLIGSTAPTQNGITGVLQSASLGVIPYYSANGGYSYNLDIGIATSFGSYSGNSYSAAGASFQNSYGNGTVSGSFFGPNASRAGLTYAIDPLIPGSGTVKGALVFQKPASSMPYTPTF